MPKQIVMPTPLLPGQTIAVAAPSSPFDPEKLHQGVEILRAMGFQVRIDDGVFCQTGYLAGSDDERVGLLNRLFKDPWVKAIICARGGFGAMRLLPKLDYKMIGRNPKMLIGFSDVTALLAAIYDQTGLMTFHGPLVTTLPGASAPSIEHFAKLLTSLDPIHIRIPNGRVINAGIAAGPLLGGNLTTLCHLLGTPYMPEFKGHILFLEDRGEKAYRIDRMLVQMKLAGCFEHIAGIVLGSFIDCAPFSEIERVFTDHFNHAGIPIIGGVALGHGADNLMLPLGCPAVLDSGKKMLSLFSSVGSTHYV